MLSELPPFEYFEPRTVSEVLEILHEHQGSAKILAGGTDLLGLMKDRVTGPKMPIPSALVNVKKVQGLRTVANRPSETTVGACVTLTEVSSDPTISSRFQGLVQAASSVGTNQIRNVGTLGGNLSQRPWCWYFRHPEYSCYKKGGRQCYAITGDNSTYFSVYNIGTCVMAHPSDTAPALISLGAKVRIASYGKAEREVPLEDFFLGPRNIRDNVLMDDELLVSVTVPYNGPRNKSVYLKHRPRNNWDFALASAAASGVVGSQGAVESVNLVLGGVATAPFLVKGIDELLIGKPLTEGSMKEAQELVAKRARPLKMNRYKVRIVKALVRRVLESALSPG